MAVIASPSGRTATKAGFFYRPEVRQAIYQIVTIVSLVILFYLLIPNTAATQAAEHRFRFGFVDRTAVFDVRSIVDFEPRYLRPASWSGCSTRCWWRGSVSCSPP